MNYYFLEKKSMNDLGVATPQELWNKVKKKHKGIASAFSAKFELMEKKDGDDGVERFKVIMSTEDEDRHGDIVKQVWELSNFEGNPVLLDSHNSWITDMVIGKVENVRVEGKKLIGEMVFRTGTERGREVYEGVRDGFLKTVSVGFIPLEFDQKGNIMRSELLELSVVAIPANAKALIQGQTKNAEIDENDDDEDTDEETKPVDNDVDVDENATIDEGDDVEEDTSVKTAQKPSLVSRLISRAKKRDEKKRRLVREALKDLKALDIGSRNQKSKDNVRRSKINSAIRKLKKAK